MASTSLTALPEYAPAAIRAHVRKRKIISGIMMGVCVVAAALAILALVAITAYVLYMGVTSLNIAFFTRTSEVELSLSDASDALAHEPTGMLNAIVGSAMLIGIASIIGVPIGLLAGTWLSQFARGRWLPAVISRCVEALAGVPSVVIGILAYVLFVQPVKEYSAFAGAMALAIIMCPIICRTTEDMLRLVPPSFREASLALGASQTQTLIRVILPAARSGIITGVMLAIARVAGETAPLLFTIHGSSQVSFNPAQPTSALPLQIFQYATSAEPEWQRQAWAGMVVLVFFILVLNLAMRIALRKRS